MFLLFSLYCYVTSFHKSKHRFGIHTTLLKNVGACFPSLREYRKLK